MARIELVEILPVGEGNAHNHNAAVCSNRAVVDRVPADDHNRPSACLFGAFGWIKTEHQDFATAGLQDWINELSPLWTFERLSVILGEVTRDVSRGAKIFLVFSHL